MKRFTSILCASLLTLAMSSVTLAGNIYGRSDNAPTTSSQKGGNIYGIYGNIYGIYGNIYGIVSGLL